MAYKRSSNNTNRPKDYFTPDSWAVERVRETRHGDAYFTLVLNGVSINNCKIAHTADNREFVGLPQYKGSDGNYYSIVYVRLSEETQREIIDEVMRQFH